MKTLSVIFTLFILLFTTAKGQWKKLNSDTSVKLTGIKILGSSSAIVIGYKGTILATADTGHTWKQINLGITNNLNAISGSHSYYSFDNSVIAIAGDSVILISTDEGSTWSIQNKPFIFTTVDHGFTTPIVGNPNTNSFSPDSTLILGTSVGRIFYTTDMGKTWKDTLLFNSKIIESDFNINTIYGYGSGTTILAASSRFDFAVGNIVDANWNYNFLGNSYWLAWYAFLSGDLAFDREFLIGAGGNPGPIPLLLTKLQTDTTWENISQNLPFPFVPYKIKNFRFAVFICGLSGRILKSTDNGNLWLEPTTPTKASLFDIQFYNSDIGYAVGDSGTILYTSSGGVTAVDENTVNIPVNYKLFQNYPNPFNPTTTINYEIPKANFVSLKIYDLLGREIATLVNKEKPAGKYEVEFNGSKLSSGIYFYRMQAGNFISTKKFVLLK